MSDDPRVLLPLTTARACLDLLAKADEANAFRDCETDPCPVCSAMEELQEACFYAEDSGRRITFWTDGEIGNVLDVCTNRAEELAAIRSLIDQRHTEVAGVYMRDLAAADAAEPPRQTLARAAQRVCEDDATRGTALHVLAAAVFNELAEGDTTHG